MNNLGNQRVVALVDMDCFYCQVEEKLQPNLKGKPVAVVQYDQSWKGGGIIAVNYQARDQGVTRYMRGDEARKVCPSITLIPVPTIRGKADLTNYRNAGDDVAAVFSEFSDCVQRASIDEAYLDLTKAVQRAIESQNKELNASDLPNTFVVGYCDLKNKSEDDRKKGVIQWLEKVEMEKTRESPDYQLAVGAKIVEKMRLEIFKKTGFHCSAGIAHNKILAKLTAGLHKPNKQTILPQDSLPEFYEIIPVQKVKNLGGKLGKQVMDQLSINFMSELHKFSISQLNQKFDEKTSQWLFNIARGIDLDPVTPRLSPESIGCCKNFRGKNSLKTKSEVEHWLKELASEISERLIRDLEKHNRRAKQLTVTFSQENLMSRCGTLTSYSASKIANDALGLIRKFNCAHANEDVWSPPILYLGLTASKFTEEVSFSIEKYLKTKINTQNAQNLPSCSKTHKEIVCKTDCDNYSETGKQTTTTATNISVKEIDKPIIKTPTRTTSNPTKSSFFLEFLNNKKDFGSAEESNPESEESEDQLKTKTSEESEKEEDQETWISLSEIFPDINEAEPVVVESLPEPFRKKFKERLNSLNSDQQSSLTNDAISEKTCQECGKIIPASEFPIHLDYHVALKLYSEINKPSSNNRVIKNPAESLSKRKKKGGDTPSKKMRNLKSFFIPVNKS